jgi:hypothetical protein
MASELDKWAAVADQARILFEFQEWLEYRSDSAVFGDKDIYAFFNVDYAQLENERGELLKKVQEEANG